MWVQERSGKEYFVEVKYSQEMRKETKIQSNNETIRNSKSLV